MGNEDLAQPSEPKRTTLLVVLARQGATVPGGGTKLARLLSLPTLFVQYEVAQLIGVREYTCWTGMLREMALVSLYCCSCAKPTCVKQPKD